MRSGRARTDTCGRAVAINDLDNNTRTRSIALNGAVSDVMCVIPETANCLHVYVNIQKHIPIHIDIRVKTHLQIQIHYGVAPMADVLFSQRMRVVIALIPPEGPAETTRPPDTRTHPTAGRGPQRGAAARSRGSPRRGQAKRPSIPNRRRLMMAQRPHAEAPPGLGAKCGNGGDLGRLCRVSTLYTSLKIYAHEGDRANSKITLFAAIASGQTCQIAQNNIPSNCGASLAALPSKFGQT